MSKLFMMLLMVISACLFSCSRENEEARIKEDIKNAFTLRKTEVNKTLNLPAELLPYERAEINARIEGYLRSVSVDIGDVVRKDEILALLDAPEIIARFAEANARSLEAEARLNASLDHYNRITTAAKQQGVVAEAELISTRNHMLADSAALLSARSTAEAYQQLQAYLTIRAPFNGIITSRSVDPGDLVGSAGKIPLMTIERPEILRLRIFVPESYVNNVPADVMITFTTESVADKVFSAKLARKSGRIDQETRTELWEYEFNNNTADLMPGMYAVAQLNLNRPSRSFVVPYSTVVTSLEKKFVIRISDNRAEWAEVREGIPLENGIEIFGDLNEGDVLLTTGSEEIKPGTAIHVNLQ